MNLDDLSKELAAIYYEGVLEGLTDGKSNTPEDELNDAKWVEEKVNANYKNFETLAESILVRIEEKED